MNGPGTLVTVYWMDQTKEPLRATVDTWSVEDGVLRLELTEDLLPPRVECKELIYPMHKIDSVSVEDYADPETQGYREESDFRESPEKSPWFRGLGRGDDRSK